MVPRANLLQPPATIVLGSEPRVVLSIAQSLSRKGIPLILASHSVTQVLRASRLWQEILILPHPAGGSQEYCERLYDRVRQGDVSWIVPCSDTALDTVCRHWQLFEEVVSVAAPGPHQVFAILDKRATYAAAERCGVPVPKTLRLSAQDATELAARGLQFPLIAKPASKQIGTSEPDFKYMKLASEDELWHLLTEKPALAESLLFQEYAPGEGVGVDVLLWGGVLVAAFQHRRLTELPPNGGVAVAAVGEPLDPLLLDYSLRLLHELRWEGIAMVEYRHDRRTGAMTLMEVNGRYFGSVALPIMCGIDFPWHHWRLTHRLPVEALPKPRRRRMRWTAGEIQRAGHLVRSLPKNGKVAQLRECMKSFTHFGPTYRSTIWTLRDPAPAMLEVIMAVRNELIQSLKALVRSVLPGDIVTLLQELRRLPAKVRWQYLRRAITRRVGIRRGRFVVSGRTPQRILFVCHGNIMRSAVAAELLRREVPMLSMGSIAVRSCGTHAIAGREPDPRAVQFVASSGGDLSSHRATALDADLAQWADLILAMDERNEAEVLARFPRERRKVFLLSEVGGHAPGGRAGIADPYRLDEHGAREVFKLVLLAVRSVASRLKSRDTASA